MSPPFRRTPCDGRWPSPSSISKDFNWASWTMPRNASRTCCFAFTTTLQRKRRRICAAHGIASPMRSLQWRWSSRVYAGPAELPLSRCLSHRYVESIFIDQHRADPSSFYCSCRDESGGNYFICTHLYLVQKSITYPWTFFCSQGVSLSAMLFAIFHQSGGCPYFQSFVEWK